MATYTSFDMFGEIVERISSIIEKQDTNINIVVVDSSCDIFMFVAAYERLQDLHALLKDRVAVECDRVWSRCDRKAIECSREAIGLT